MTTTECDELLTTLFELRTLLPELRFGQLVATLAAEARGINDSAMWDVEDAELLSATQLLLAETKARRALPA